MKTSVLLIIGILIFGSTFSQDSTSPEARRKIQAARIALISERLGLTPEQAEKFWPVYREFSQKRQGGSSRVYSSPTKT